MEASVRVPGTVSYWLNFPKNWTAKQRRTSSLNKSNWLVLVWQLSRPKWTSTAMEIRKHAGSWSTNWNNKKTSSRYKVVLHISDTKFYAFQCVPDHYNYTCPAAESVNIIEQTNLQFTRQCDLYSVSPQEPMKASTVTSKGFLGATYQALDFVVH